MIAYVFPGQGSQRKGMGEGLFEEFPDLTRQADEILGYSIRELCLENSEGKLDQTQYTQPALYTVNALSWLKKTAMGKKPDFLAGHSLGEFNALHAAGVFSFETGLSLVKKRGELMSAALNGGMAAIINSSEDQIREILFKAGLEAIDIANFNSHQQIIISGMREDINKSQEHFENGGARFVPLNTSGAFHSRYMKDASGRFGHYLNEFVFAKPEIPVMANVSALPYEQDGIVRNLTEQITHSVRWTGCVEYLLDKGVTAFEELGVGDVLTKLIASIKRARASAEKAAKPRDALPAPVALENASPQPIAGEAEKAAEQRAAAPDEIPLTAAAAAQAAWPDSRQMVKEWNALHPVGTRVVSALYDNALETRTEAMILFGHRAAVYMKGYNGYFDLREVKPVQTLQGHKE